MPGSYLGPKKKSKATPQLLEESEFMTPPETLGLLPPARDALQSLKCALPLCVLEERSEYPPPALTILLLPQHYVRVGTDWGI